MDPLDFLESEELLRFFHCKKTTMSCMENPLTFLTQLRDHNLIPEKRYQMVSHMKSKENIKKGLYDILDEIEKEQSQHIHLFWRCIFQDIIIYQYPTLQHLRKSLMDGSYLFEAQLPEMVKKEQPEEKKWKLSWKKKKKKKKKQRSMKPRDSDEEQPGPSSQLRPVSTLKKREKDDVWASDVFKSQLPVTCGDLKGALSKDKLAKGKECILFDTQWFTPGEFEKLAGKESRKNWKLSIWCNGIPLAKLIQKGHLKSASFRRGSTKAKKALFPSDHVMTEESEDEEDQSSSTTSSTNDTDEDEEETEHQQEANSSRTRFKFTSGALAGTLYKHRFASGTRGKSIRTETSWMSPEEFVKKASCTADASWEDDIKWEGKPLSDLIKENILKTHSSLCHCRRCQPRQKDMEDEKNDDECCVCKNDEGPELVVCDQCPRSFHKKCHLPHVEDAILRDDKPWICTFCVFRTFQEWRYNDELEMQAALSQQINKYMLECQYLLLYLCSAEEEQTFVLNPNLYTPMWFGKVAEKLQKNKYQTVGEFVSDVQLICTSCAKYSQNDAEYLDSGRRLKELFDGEFKKVFIIRK